MTSRNSLDNIRRLLVVMPTWVGDAVMATPTLTALRNHFHNADIIALARPAAAPIIDNFPAVDQIITIKADEDRSISGLLRLAKQIKSQHFHAAVVLPNSFRSALLIRLAGIPMRIGIKRDGRGLLLTDRVPDASPDEYDGPEPTVLHYLRIAKFLGVELPDTTMHLSTSQADDQRADKLLLDAGLSRDDHRPLAIINPGANYGDAKIWPADRFAKVAQRITGELDMVCAVTGSPKERPILDEVISATNCKILDLPANGLDLLLLKSVVKRSSLMITNDTGPRHIAAAFKIPLVTVFGPTDPRLTRIDFSMERQVYVDVECGPCQKKQCPLTGSPDELCCMRQIDPDMIFTAAREILLKAGAEI